MTALRQPAAAAPFHFDLPPELIAQRPTQRRDGSRLMIVDRAGLRLSHALFSDIPSQLKAGDLLVLNRSPVAPTRFYARSAGRTRLFDILLMAWDPPNACEALIKGGGRLKSGDTLVPVDHEGLEQPSLRIRFVGQGAPGRYLLDCGSAESLALARRLCGRAPLPPYIRREMHSDPREDLERYQTVFALGEAGNPNASIAAPTAGLHFTPELLERLEALGVSRAYLELHVGWGTFQPIRSATLDEHKMHQERFAIPEESAQAILEAKRAGRRVVCVGTTSVRALESAWQEAGPAPGEGATTLFIRPGYRFRAPDALLTNFHLPGSTLLMLVAAFAGQEFILETYREAVRERYRFFSYGDAMLIV